MRKVLECECKVMKKAEVMEMLKARKIEYSNDFKDNIVIKIN